MAVQFGPSFLPTIPPDASYVFVTTTGGSPAVLTAPVAVDSSGRISFTVETPGKYRVSVSQADQSGETYPVDLTGSGPVGTVNSIYDYIDTLISPIAGDVDAAANTANTAQETADDALAAAVAAQATVSEMAAGGIDNAIEASLNNPATDLSQLMVSDWIGGVRPEIYGAVGDGVADDTIPLQTALANHKDVLLGPDKTYLVSSTLTVREGCTLRGSGGGAFGLGSVIPATRIIVKSNTATTAIIALEKALVADTYIMPENLSAVSFQAADYPSGTGNCATGVSLADSATARGVVVNGMATQGFITSNRAKITACYAGRCNIGFSLAGPDGTIFDSVATFCHTAGMKATANFWRVVGCRLEWNARYGIHAAAEGTYIGNLFDRNGFAGLYLPSGSWGSVVTGNDFTRNGCGGNGNYGRWGVSTPAHSSYVATSAVESCHIRMVFQRGVTITGNRFRSGNDDADQGAFSPLYIYSFGGSNGSTGSANFFRAGNAGETGTVLGYAQGNGTYVETAAIAGGSDTAAITAGNTLSTTRTGARPVGQGELVVNVKDYGAVGNNSTDDTAAFVSAIADAGNGGTVMIPPGNYVVGSTLVIPTGTSLVGSDKASLSRIRFTTLSTQYGIDYDGGSLGASSFDTVRVANLQFAGVAKAYVRFKGCGLFRVERIISLSQSSCVLRFESCQDFIVRDVDVLTGGVTDNTGEGAVLYFDSCNNVYLNYIRVESPRGTAISALNSSGLFWTQGKIDGNESAGSSVAPYVKLDASWGRFVNIHLDGAVYFPVELANAGSWVEFSDCHFQNNGVDAIVKVTSPNAFRDLASYLPGSLQTPWVSFRHCRVVAESRNQSNRDTKALVYSDGVEPTYSPNGETFPMTASGGGLVSGDVQRVLKWGALADQLPPRNDQYVGAWLTRMDTGFKKRIYYNLANGQTTVDHQTLADFPTGATYRLEYTKVDGVRVDISDVTVQYRTRQKVFHVTTETVTGLSVSSRSYSTFVTTVVVSGGTPAASWVGKYLTKADGTQWLIRGYSGQNLLLDYDVTTGVTVASGYSIRAGRGSDSTLSWYE